MGRPPGSSNNRIFHSSNNHFLFLQGARDRAGHRKYRLMWESVVGGSAAAKEEPGREAPHRDSSAVRQTESPALSTRKEASGSGGGYRPEAELAAKTARTAQVSRLLKHLLATA